MIQPPDRGDLTGQENLHTRGVPWSDSSGHATVEDFWRWAYGDLRSDEIRGPFAEFLVARLLGEHLQGHIGWPYDFNISNGLRVEVKSAAYLQAWPLTKYTSIRFSGLKSKKMTPGAGFAVEATRNADIYVFCVLETKEAERFDPLDLGQWKFYVISA